MAEQNSSSESNFVALLQEKCPRCHTGKVFKHPPYTYKFMQMHELCPHCGLVFEIEPGFFYGAMYISYAITVAVGLVVTVGTYLLLDNPETWVYLATLLATLILLSPFSFRYSRLMMLYWFGGIDYDPKLKRKSN